jgi:AcrR family transcriptional regulator
LSRRAIVEATTELAREDGLAAVSLRRVATRLETGPASLYAYFENREQLLAHVLDDAYARVDLVDGDRRTWRDALAATVVNTVDALQELPGLGSVALGSVPVLPGALRLADHELGLMEVGGVPAPRAALAVDLLAQFAAATAVERGDPSSTALRPVDVRSAYESADAERFPRVVRAAAALTVPDAAARRDFALATIIGGLTRR